MLAGLTAEDKRKTLSIVDRREAIRTACLLAQPGDVILVAGKGHEDYQEIKGVKHHSTTAKSSATYLLTTNQRQTNALLSLQIP